MIKRILGRNIKAKPNSYCLQCVSNESHVYALIGYIECIVCEPLEKDGVCREKSIYSYWQEAYYSIVACGLSCLSQNGSINEAGKLWLMKMESLPLSQKPLIGNSQRDNPNKYTLERERMESSENVKTW